MSGSLGCIANCCWYCGKETGWEKRGINTFASGFILNGVAFGLRFDLTVPTDLGAEP